MNNPDFSVLAIDDNEDDILLLERLLERAGVPRPLLAFHSGEQALASLAAKMRSNPTGVPRLVFLDNKMPGMGGLAVLQWLRQQPAFNETAVAMLSSCEDPNDFERAAALGAQCYLIKHPTVDELVRVIDEARKFSQSTANRSYLFRGAYNRLPVDELELPGADRGR